MDGPVDDRVRVAAIRRAPFVYTLIAVDLVAVVLYSLTVRAPFDWWLVVLGAVVVVSLTVPLPGVVIRAAPMVLIGVVFLALGGLSDHQRMEATTTLPIAVDRALVAAVVPVWLQEHLGALLGAPAAVLVVVYLLHYVTPIATASWLWRRHRERFDGFVAAYTLAMVAGFAVYLAAPTTPPWYAAGHGLLPPLHRTIVDVLQAIGAGHLYAGADPEPFGAMPSLHVTIPVLVAAATIGAQRSRWRWLWVVYPLTVAFGVLLMAEHYLVDTLAGAGLGLVALAVVALLPRQVVSGSDAAARVGVEGRARGSAV